MVKTVGYVPTPEAAAACVAWAEYVNARTADLEGEDAQPVTYLCADPHGGAETVDAVRARLPDAGAGAEALPAIEPLDTAMERTRAEKATVLVSSLAGLPPERAIDLARRLLKVSPSATVVGLWGERPPEHVRRILLVLSDSAHDLAMFRLARAVASTSRARITVARIEPDVGDAARQLGEREVQRFLHEVGADEDDGVERRIVVDNHPVRGIVSCYDDHDLVLVGSSDLDLVRSLDGAFPDAQVSLVKRMPPLRRRQLPDWIPQVNASDYAELAQTLRRGSRWSADFVVMLGLASAIASLGLIQNSAAVVIGSMLLAPLMTPMLGFGLGLAQANGLLVRQSGRAIGLGFLMTLVISFVLGHVSFRETLSPEVVARTAPNLLDLGIALCAAVAAAFALARPSLSGAVAGVAIATALVPPVCAAGICLAAGETGSGLGAAVLFFTNLLAIVIASAVTFLLMGISVPHHFTRARRLARHAFVGLVVVLLLLSVPLGVALDRQLAEGRAQPMAYPVTRALSRRLHERVERGERGEAARIMALGRNAITHEVVVWVAADHDVTKAWRDELRAIVRDEMDEPDLVVHVVAVRSAMDD